jgi:8-oxo-dGTP pyrophosphatase MutT (NUDIX family)
LDKKSSIEQTMVEEIEEECGYKVNKNDLIKIDNYLTG